MTKKPEIGTRPVLTQLVVRERLRDHVYVMYLNYAFFIKGAVVAVAGLSLYLIWLPDSVEFQYERTALWLASVGFSIVTIATWSRGAAFTNSRASVFDFILPIAMGICEVLLFTVIWPPDTERLHNERAQHFWILWYLIFGLHALLASALVGNRLYAADAEEYAMDVVVKPKWKDYRDWLKLDSFMAAVLGALGVAMFIACEHCMWLRTTQALPYHVAVGLGLFILSMFITGTSASQYGTLNRI